MQGYYYPYSKKEEEFYAKLLEGPEPYQKNMSVI